MVLYYDLYINILLQKSKSKPGKTQAPAILKQLFNIKAVALSQKLIAGGEKAVTTAVNILKDVYYIY